MNVVLIRMIEIALRECRFGGSKNALINHSHSVHNCYEMEKRTRVFYSNNSLHGRKRRLMNTRKVIQYCTRVLRLKKRKTVRREVCISMCAR